MIFKDRKYILNTILFFGLGIVLSACGGSDGNSNDPNSGGTASFTLGITDAPVDGADEVVVQFTGIEFKINADEDATGGDAGTPPAEGSNTENTATDTNITFAEPKTIDLLALQGGVRELLLDGQELPAGQYGQIRLLVQAEIDTVFDSYITVDGAQHELRIPSGSQTGLKLVVNFDLGAESTSDFTIDFDLRKSVVFSPGQGYHLKPVLKLIETESASEISGIVDPIVFAEQTCSETDPLVSYAVYLYEGSDVTPDDLGSQTPPFATTTVTLNETSNFAYTLGFVEPGNYTIAATCQADLDEPETDDEIGLVGASNITVTEGTATPHNF